MKRSVIITALLTAVVSLTAGCVPGNDKTIIEVNPDFVVKQDVQLDFVQLHNDAFEGIASIEDGEPFVFVENADIDGDEAAHSVVIRASVMDGASEEDCRAFAAALLCQINDSAVTQNPTYEASTETSFGSLYNDYGIDLCFTNAEDDGVIYTLTVPAGDEITLDPGYMKYVDAWKQGMEIYKENLVYDINGNIVRNEN